MHFGTDIADITVLLLLLQSLFYIGNCCIQCNILYFDLTTKVASPVSRKRVLYRGRYKRVKTGKLLCKVTKESKSPKV